MLMYLLLCIELWKDTQKQQSFSFVLLVFARLAVRYKKMLLIRISLNTLGYFLSQI